MDIEDTNEPDSFIKKRVCQKCYHQWFPRAGNPQRCPRCQVWLNKKGSTVTIAVPTNEEEEKLLKN